ncbi:MAG TPA: hypothetical protein VGJ81_09960 [Thermoanaerobaculia bacterium]|jgi:hypothetical protein
MEPITYLLGIASTVVANLLAELISGQAKRARQEEIERHVAVALAREARHSSDNARGEAARVMAEVSLLIARHPHLSLKGTDVVLAKAASPGFVSTARRRSAILIEELRQLDDIVTARRAELTPNSDASLDVEDKDVVSDPHVNADTPPEAPAGRWAVELAKMGDEIRRRREEPS